MKMTSKEALNKLSNYIGQLGGGETLEEEDIILRDLEVLEILKDRIHLKDSTLKLPRITIGKTNLPKCENDFKEVEVVFVEASGFVFKNSDDYKLLKEWLENGNE